jgi:hypothetical protein
MKKILLMMMVTHAFAGDNTVAMIQELCGLAKKGTYSTSSIQTTGGINGGVKLVSANLKGQWNMTQGAWNGVQQVLKVHQAGDNHDYRECVKEALPYFKAKGSSEGSKSTKVTQTNIHGDNKAKFGEKSKNANLNQNNIDGDNVVNF